MSVPGGPALKTRRAATDFNVRSGQTLILAGFLSKEESRNIDQIPGLGSIPILGRLFGSRRFQRNETELALFVTPIVVNPDQPALMRRIDRSRAILKNAFLHENMIHVTVNTAGIMPPPRRVDATTGVWNVSDER